MKIIKELIIKYRELITYVFFGALTTGVNFLSFKLFGIVFGTEYYLVSNILAWVVSVFFAYFTNKLWVFRSTSFDKRLVFKEISSFFAARTFSFVLEEIGLYIFVDVMDFDFFKWEIFSFEISGQMVAKIILAVVVVILNYVFSKLFIFKKKKSQ